MWAVMMVAMMIYCCANLTAALLVIGIMDLRAMAAVMAAITAERLASHTKRNAQAVGAATVVTGVVLIAQAVGWHDSV